VITVDGVMHGVSPDAEKREIIFSINCNDATIRTARSNGFEIEENERVSWGVLFSKARKVVLKGKSKVDRDQWIRVLQHFQSNPVDFDGLLKKQSQASNESPPPPPLPPPPPPEEDESVDEGVGVGSLSATSDDGEEHCSDVENG